jgi:hypothetical protein
MQVLEPRYKIPARTTLYRKIIPDVYHKAVKSVKKSLASDFLSKSQYAAAPAYSFTTDVWTSRAMDPYISFTLSYINEQCQLKAFALENKHFPGNHTASKILETLEKSIDEWELPFEIPIFRVRDNGSNIKAAVRQSVWFDVACFAHTLQLAILDAVNNVGGMEHMLKKCKQIVSHYHHSCITGARIDKFQEENDLPQYEFIMSCPTRWNSEYAMVERLLVLKAAVRADIVQVGDVENLTTYEWELAEGFTSVCQPLAEATEVSRGEDYPTRSMVIPILFGIFDKLHKFISSPASKGYGVTFAREVFSALETRFPNYKTAIPDCMSTYLDPRFKRLLFDDEAVGIIQQQLEEFANLVMKNSLANKSAVPFATASASNADLQQIVQVPIADEVSESTSSGSQSGDNLWSSIDLLSQRSRVTRRPLWTVAAVSQEMELYTEDPPVQRSSCPLKWWAENGSHFKTLSLLARAFLCVPATQTKSQRLNSTSGHIVEDRRSRLLTQHVIELTFLHENL